MKTQWCKMARILISSNQVKRQEDLQHLHLTSSSSASTEKEEEKKEESREIKSLRNTFLGGEDKSVFEPFKREKKSSSPSVQSDNQGHLSGRDFK